MPATGETRVSDLGASNAVRPQVVVVHRSVVSTNEQLGVSSWRDYGSQGSRV